MKHIQTIETRDLCQSAKNGGGGGGPTPPPPTRRVPDILPVCLQDQLRYCQSGLREEEQRLSCENHGAALAGRHFWRRDQI